MGVIHKEGKQSQAVLMRTAITSLYCSSVSTERTAEGTMGSCVCDSVPGSLAVIATLDTPASPSSPDTIY